ncbi:DUF3592 domain-containing protein [Streptodolium elevatio]|uniref:DUF3592 domain-containing protein n=1 Tax=Streptodolium elevatio TaxID=3157996 RepID=A0ABV3DD39_9ACTN
MVPALVMAAIGLVLAVLGFGVLRDGLLPIRDALILRRRGVRVTGDLMRYEHLPVLRRGRYRGSEVPVYRFPLTDGGFWEARSITAVRATVRGSGTRVEVVYDPEDPDRVTGPIRHRGHVGTAFVLLLGLVALGLFVFLWTTALTHVA